MDGSKTPLTLISTSTPAKHFFYPPAGVKKNNLPATRSSLKPSCKQKIRQKHLFSTFSCKIPLFCKSGFFFLGHRPPSEARARHDPSTHTLHRTKNNTAVISTLPVLLFSFSLSLPLLTVIAQTKLRHCSPGGSSDRARERARGGRVKYKPIWREPRPSTPRRSANRIFCASPRKIGTVKVPWTPPPPILDRPTVYESRSKL